MVHHSVKYLGMLTDDDLSFKHQCEKMKKFCSAFRVLRTRPHLKRYQLQTTRQTNCAVWRFGVWLPKYTNVGQLR